ncbi:MFS general substrate transporter [Cutaneotrichosporon oleaginosum]|uniref:MFS general substrate transporter n=1 Tax=Cutaneotrichosporon oleaginosum TaxID=879819 RepID=A0A0J0XUA7_9TREE|nr:MFS general substrate transporter [Cutaneotrichosporon oleaginosum]KLT44627.1 MFS general substrate transporter [Cutaneotrichosporon oleaginosum]TXT07613.1 hypothetical protein COLE_04537 [Cutaneotrichosporon oleaginosum]
MPLDPVQERRVRRKTDCIIMPVICLVYAMNFLDKTALTYASVMGLFKDTKITGDQFSWVASIYYFGYLAGTFPMVYGLQRLPLAKFTSFNIIVWGISVGCTAAVNNYAGLLGLRFILGIFESGMVPAILLVVAEWYKPHEQGTRTGVWGSMTSWGCILGGGVAYALAIRQEKGTLALAGWRIVYIWLGAMTITVGLLFLFLIPDSIEKAWFLTPEQKEVAHRRTLENKQHIGEKEWKWYQVREVATDPQVYILALITLCSNVPTGGLVNFFALIVKGIGYNSAETLLLTMANASLGAATMFWMWAGDKAKCRTLVSGTGVALSIIGGVLLWALPLAKKEARLAGFYLCIWNSIATYIATSMVTTNVAGRTKKSVCSGGYVMFLCIGQLIGPQTFRAKHAPRYAPALLTMVILTAINVGLLILLYCYYRAQNAKKDRLYGRPNKIEKDVWVDLTDRENPEFRYVY